jgi:LmbE family N-acetylglucosaminyl deacetylase
VVSALTTTVTFCAHQDDDLLFMNPDVASDIQAGHDVWVVYLTAGDIPHRPGRAYGGIVYSDLRIQGLRAAYARAAKLPSDWVYEELILAGHPVATNRLNGASLRLVFTFIHAAANPEDPCGDLWRMWHDPGFVAQPIDGRPAYDQASFLGLLRAVLDTAGPDFIRSQSTIGHHEGDHIDHTSAALLVADADVDAAGRTLVRRDEYTCYPIAGLPDNVFGYWRDEKTDIWNQYWPHDPELNGSLWQDVMGRQYSLPGRSFPPGHPWLPPDDFTTC